MSVTIPDDIVRATRWTEDELRLALAVHLFEADRLTLAQAARLAGKGRAAFQHVLASRGIPVHYGQEGLAMDAAVLREPEP